jgi:hypothetical protein
MGLQETIISDNTKNRADFKKEDFDNLVKQKGSSVLLEYALQCPCKGAVNNQLSNCRNCGGSGWVYINPTKTKMILTGIGVSTKYAPWSEEAIGKVAITAYHEEQLSYMDKITKLDSTAIFSEVVQTREVDGVIFSYTKYDIKKILYIAVFVNGSTVLQRLTGDQYTFSKNILRISPGVLSDPKSTLTIRYKHHPAFYILEFEREARQFATYQNGKEVMQQLPISAYAKRLHYDLSPVNLSNNFLLNNSYVDNVCGAVQDTSCSMNLSNTYDFYLVQGDTLDQTINILEGGEIVDITSRVYIMQVRDANNVLLTEFTIANGGIIIIPPNGVRLVKTTLQTSSYPVGLYKYDLQETNGSVVSTILSGNFIVTEQQTIP